MNQVGEACDDAGVSASCDADCTEPVCGDGVVNLAAGEACDDGNASNGDACVAGCEAAACGDGYLRTGVEVCDPGLESGCLPDCSGYVPTGCLTLGTCFGVEHRHGGTLTDNTMAPYFRLRNNGTTSVNLAQVRIRYWFSADTASPSFATNCYWAALVAGSGTNGCNLVARTVTAVPSPAMGATHTLDVTFGATAGTLSPGQSTGEIQLSVNKGDWSNFYESNDYSATGAMSTPVAATHVAVYVSGALVWGDEW